MKAAATRSRILDAARDVLIERGFAQFTTRAVASVAGVSEGLIFHYFADKDGLLVELALVSTEPIREAMAGLAAQSGTGDVLNNLVDALDELSSAYAAVRGLDGALQADPELAATVSAALATARRDTTTVQRLTQYLESERALGRVNDISFEAVSFLLIAACRFASSQVDLGDGLDGSIFADNFSVMIIATIAAGLVD